MKIMVSNFSTPVVLLLVVTLISLTAAQRKISRTTQSNAEVKTPVNFDCPEEFGYYPHPNDCTQYYVCVFGGALLESCTGGLMYSHELQTCDWPRNVGCDGAEISASPSAPAASSPATRGRDRDREEAPTRTRYVAPPPPAQPSAVVTSRGQPRQLHHNQQEIIKQQQQQQLYADAEESLPPAEEIESDRQQRVYRGQPSTVGQVQRDRDGLRHTNAIPTYSGRSEKIGVISFGTQQQQHYNSKLTDDNTLITNDITLKRRRKRQIHRRPHESDWHGSRNTKPFNRHNHPIPFIPSLPQTKQIAVKANYHSNFDEFRPFIPDYKRNNYQYFSINSDQKTTPSTQTKDNYSYFNLGSTQQPLRHIQAAFSHIRPNYTRSPDVTQAVTTSYSNQNANVANEGFQYPVFKSVNKYEHIENPFAKPDFDFNQFLQSFETSNSSSSSTSSNSNSVKKVEVPKEVATTVRPQHPQTHANQYVELHTPVPFIVNKHKQVPASEYYYDDYEESSQKPKPNKMYSSQIKSINKNNQNQKVVALKNNPASSEYEYYYDDYEYPETKKNVKSYYYEEPERVPAKNATSKNKYSAKYQQENTPTSIPKILSTSTATYTKLTTSSTTPKTVYTIRQRSRTSTVRPTTRKTTRGTTRQRLTSTTQRIDTDSKREQSKLTLSEESSVAPPKPSVSTATARNLYNSTHYNNNQYDPYYALYDDDVELYRDVDYSHNNYNNAQQQTPQPQTTYRGTPAPAVQSTATPVEESSPKRGHSVYLPNNYNQDIYQHSTVSDYNEDNNFSNQQVDDQTSYRQSSRQPSRLNLRGDRNELNDVEEATTKRTATRTTTRFTTTRTTTTTTPFKKSTPQLSRTPVTANENQTQAQSIINTIPEDPGQTSTTPKHILPAVPNPEITDATTTLPITYRPKFPDSFSDYSVHEPYRAAVVKKPAPFSLPNYLTTEQPKLLKPAFHYITKPPKSAHQVFASAEHVQPKNAAAVSHQIIPTTYSPPKFFLKSILSPKNTNKTELGDNVISVSKTTDHLVLLSKPFKTLKSVRKLINPIAVNHELSTTTGTTFESAEKLSEHSDNDYKPFEINPIPTTMRYSTNKPTLITTTSLKPSSTFSTTTTSTTTTTTEKPKSYINDEYIKAKLREYIQPVRYNYTNLKPFRNTVEIPPPLDLSEPVEKEKFEPDELPAYKPKPIPKPFVLHTATRTDVPLNTSLPTRVSRVNAAIKSLIAIGGSRRQNAQCNENQTSNSKCNDAKQRNSQRGRGSSHYSGSGGIANNEVAVTVNRGTPAPRSRPTLKPSTSIVSKAQEFVDIYKFPPRRPETLYPQPQPDKTAAKCRKDVCLLPDCSCGGKEIPGDIPVEQVPQIVLITYDDSVNDLNKGLYSDLFEKGRTNPNGCPIAATFYVSHEWTDYSQVQNLYSDGHEIASHTVSHSFGEQFSQKKWTREVAGQREILSAYGGVHLEDVRGMRAPFLSVGGNKMFKMLYDSNFTYDSSMPIYENKPPSWPYTLDYKLFHDCMIPPCPTRSYPGVWEVPMVMWQDLNGGRCSMGDACSNPPDAEGVFKMLMKNFERHYSTNRAPFGLFYHAAWFTQPHHKEGFINFIDNILAMKDVWLTTNWQALQWVRDPTPTSRLGSFQPFQCDFSDRPKRCNNPKVCNLWHKSGVRYMRTCQPCPDIYPWTGNSGIRSSRIDNDIED